MRYVRDQTGRFAERPHYEPKELDTMFERIIVDFLKAQHGKVAFPISTDDLTVLIERDAEDLDPYADLSPYGDGVEGVTEFTPGRKPRVRIAEALATSDNHENRYRTTLTHEYGHVRLHGYLFSLSGSGPGLFGTPAKPNVIACKRDTMVSAARTDWGHDKSCAQLYDTEERVGNFSSVCPCDSLAAAGDQPRNGQRQPAVACRQADDSQDGWLNSA